LLPQACDAPPAHELHHAACIGKIGENQ